MRNMLAMTRSKVLKIKRFPFSVGGDDHARYWGSWLASMYYVMLADIVLLGRYVWLWAICLIYCIMSWSFAITSRTSLWYTKYWGVRSMNHGAWSKAALEFPWLSLGEGGKASAAKVEMRCLGYFLNRVLVMGRILICWGAEHDCEVHFHLYDIF